MRYVKPLYIGMSIFLSSCTITFDQVMTYGTAADVIDNTPTTDVRTEVNTEIPAPL